MTEGDFFEANESSLSSGQVVTLVDPANAGTGAVEIHTIYHGDDMDVIMSQDTDGDGSEDMNLTIDSLTGQGISQQNKIELSSSRNQTLKIAETASVASNVSATGVEITD